MSLKIPQSLFLDQARSDYEVYGRLRGAAECHRLHYLQMCTEKLAKVYFWRNGNPVGLKHHVFEPFLRDLETSRPRDFHQMFGYVAARRFSHLKSSILDLASRIQNLAPGGRNPGPNPEYPWPPAMPTLGPLAYSFPEWRDWNQTTAGRRLHEFVRNLLENYSTYFP